MFLEKNEEAFYLGVLLTPATYSSVPYPNYIFIFPIKALGMFAQRYGDQVI
jgi:hypothetical protein